MTVHKITGDDRTACGLHIWENEIEASRDDKEVTCKKCKKKSKKVNTPQ